MITEAAIICLALNIYHEARGEPIEGQIAVSLVVLNRAKKARTSACREIYRPEQFSWTKNLPPVRNQRLLKKLRITARHATRLRDYTGGADHYHAAHVFPEWARRMQYVGRWGNHLFYKEK
jgi:spore germination cell wall hydrolase CwlJ-like protein